MKKMLALTVGFTLALLAAAGVRADDCEPHPVLVVTEWAQDWENLSMTIDNPSSSLQQGVAVVWFYDDGNLTGWGSPVDVPGDSVMHLGLRLSDGGRIIGPPVVCKNPPHSITDAPDPVMRTTEPRQGKDKGNGNSSSGQ